MSSDDWCVVGSDGTKEEGSSIRLDILKRSYEIEWTITNGDALLGHIHTPRFAFIPGQPKTWRIGCCWYGDKADFTLAGHAGSEGLTIDAFEVEILDVRGLVNQDAGGNITLGNGETVWCSFDGASEWLRGKIVVNIKMTVYGEMIIEEYNYFYDTKCGDLDLKELREDYLRMMQEDQFANLTIHVGEKSFKAHKAVLRCRAPEFAQKYLNDRHSITIHDDIKPEVFRDVLVYMYTGDLSIEILELRALEIYKAAHLYGLTGLRRACSNWIVKNVSENIVCDVWIAAEQFNDMGLEIAACTYMQQNLIKMKLRDDFESLVNKRDDFLPEIKRVAMKFGNYEENV